jgi:DNA-binding NarL/FixJ family response regulator
MTVLPVPADDASERADAAAQPRTRVVLADDNPEILEVVMQVLKNSYVIAGAFLDGDSVLREWQDLRPDILILDISMGERSGLEVAERLQARCAQVKIVFLTVYEDSEFVTSALAAGASAYVFKSRIATDLIPAIDQVRMGRMFVSSWQTI